MAKLTIDNREIRVENGETILQAARMTGISIPTLCYHEAVAPYAACRLCVVELVSHPLESSKGKSDSRSDLSRNPNWTDTQPFQAAAPANARGKIVAACAQECEEGMDVLTNSPRVQTSRRVTAELLMATGAHLPRVQAIAKAAGVEKARYSLPPDDCILCGLCVRACDELVGAHAISLVERGLKKKVAPPFEIASAACIGCATCVLICPTGAITLKDLSPSPPSLLGKGDGELGHDPRACRVCGEQSLPQRFADVGALFGEKL